jgi:hypothetical protein
MSAPPRRNAPEPDEERMRTTTIACAFVLAALPALAKLPAPTDEAKAKAAEAAAKTAWTNKVADYQLCKAQDKVAAGYLAKVKSGAKAPSAAASGAPTPVATPACTDPGPFAYTPPEATPPIEASGAHSPPKTATDAPSTNTPAAAQPKKP